MQQGGDEFRVNFMSKHLVSIAVQTDGKDYKGIEQFMKEQTVELERFTMLNGRLKTDMHALRNTLEVEREEKQKISEVVMALKN